MLLLIVAESQHWPLFISLFLHYHFQVPHHLSLHAFIPFTQPPKEKISNLDLLITIEELQEFHLQLQKTSNQSKALDLRQLQCHNEQQLAIALQNLFLQDFPNDPKFIISSFAQQLGNPQFSPTRIIKEINPLCWNQIFIWGFLKLNNSRDLEWSNQVFDYKASLVLSNFPKPAKEESGVIFKKVILLGQSITLEPQTAADLIHILSKELSRLSPAFKSSNSEFIVEYFDANFKFPFMPEKEKHEAYKLYLPSPIDQTLESFSQDYVSFLKTTLTYLYYYEDVSNEICPEIDKEESSEQVMKNLNEWLMSYQIKKEFKTENEYLGLLIHISPEFSFCYYKRINKASGVKRAKEILASYALNDLYQLRFRFQ